MIDVCYEVGYNSLGSFTTRFTQLIGLPPTRLRELSERPAPLSLTAAPSNQGFPAGIAAHGRIRTSDSAIAMIFVGLFTTPIPQGHPAGCTLLAAPGAYQIGPVPDGRYYLFAVGFPKLDDPLHCLLPDATQVRFGSSPYPLTVRRNRAGERRDIVLRAGHLTDPPLLSALPLLLPKYLPAPSK